MSKSQQQTEAEELVRFCERQVGDSECGYYWQSQFKRIAKLLRELALEHQRSAT